MVGLVRKIKNIEHPFYLIELHTELSRVIIFFIDSVYLRKDRSLLTETIKFDDIQDF